MFKLFFLITIAHAVAVVRLPEGGKFFKEFDVWRNNFGKVYHTKTDEIKHFRAFQINHQMIEEHNEGKHSYQLKHNQFSDLSVDKLFLIQ